MIVNAIDEFHKRLAALARKHGYLPLTHETTYDAVTPILREGIINFPFCTIGFLNQASFVTKGMGVIMHVRVPLKHAMKVVPDMRFGGTGEEETYQALLDEFPELEGAEVGTEIEVIPPSWIVEVLDNATLKPY